MDVVPSFLNARAVDDLERSDGGAFSNTMLRVGEVVKVIYPEDPQSRSKQFVEYNVLVQHRENNTAVTKLYENCTLMNTFGGLADSQFWTLRTDPQNGTGLNSQGTIQDGTGSKVLIHCINGEHASGVIVGGIRDTQDSDQGVKALGHHYRFEFNGVVVQIRDDGSVQLQVTGKTASDGSQDPGADKDGAGTAVEIKANGNFEVRTPGSAQTVVVDHKAATIKVEAASEMVITGDKVRIGDSADEHQVMGDTLVGLLGELCDQLAQEVHLTAVGQSSPPVNAPAYVALKQRLRTVLSDFAFVKKSR